MNKKVRTKYMLTHTHKKVGPYGVSHYSYLCITMFRIFLFHSRTIVHKFHNNGLIMVLIQQKYYFLLYTTCTTTYYHDNDCGFKSNSTCMFGGIRIFLQLFEAFFLETNVFNLQMKLLLRIYERRKNKF